MCARSAIVDFTSLCDSGSIMASPLFSIPIPSTKGTFTCSNPSTSDADKEIYILTFVSPPDNRLTPEFVDAFILALDIIEHRYPKGVVVTTSGIPKFYSNGLDLELALTTEGFLDKQLWKLFRRLLTYVSFFLSFLSFLAANNTHT